MGELLPVENFRGSLDVMDGDPRIVEVIDGVYLPHDGGVYDDSKALADAVGTYHGPERYLHLPAAVTAVDVAAVTARAPDPHYIYGGLIHDHFGHALLSTLSRFWILARMDRPGIKIVIHGSVDMLDRPYFRAWLAGLGLERSDFVTFDQPTRLTRLTVPELAFEEMLTVHRVFAELCHAMAEHLGVVRRPRPDLPPVYLSKGRLDRGVQRLRDEASMEQAMARQGVEVVYPEQLSFNEQVSLLHERPFLLSAAGSSLHTSIFVKGGCKIVALVHQPFVHGNYGLIDRVNGNSARYFYKEAKLIAEEGSPFQFDFDIGDHEEVAAEMVAIARNL